MYVLFHDGVVSNPAWIPTSQTSSGSPTTPTWKKGLLEIHEWMKKQLVREMVINCSNWNWDKFFFSYIVYLKSSEITSACYEINTRPLSKCVNLTTILAGHPSMLPIWEKSVIHCLSLHVTEGCRTSHVHNTFFFSTQLDWLWFIYTSTYNTLYRVYNLFWPSKASTMLWHPLGIKRKSQNSMYRLNTLQWEGKGRNDGNKPHFFTEI